MTDISLIHTSGGLLGDVFTDALRQPVVDGDPRFLADIATFTNADGAPPTRAQHDSDFDAAFRTGQALWSAYSDELARGMDVSRLRERLLLPLLNLLGFDPVYQRSRLTAGGDTWPISHLGWRGHAAPPIHLVPDLDLDERGPRHRSPHEELQGYLNNVPVRWGMLSNGRVLRLMRDYHHTRTRGYVEFDLAAIFEGASHADFLALWRLTHASRFRPLTEQTSDGDHLTLLEKSYEQALDAGVAAGKRLQPQVREALETLANGLLDATPGLRHDLGEHPDHGRDFHRELLTVLYRVLFLLFAEQRGMLKQANPLYDETYSLTALRARAEADDAEPRRQDLWEGLKTTFRIFGDEALAATVGVYPYNGQLFDLARTPLTGRARCSNKATLDAIRALTTVHVGRVPMHVDYRNLGVEELGTVYESLLDYTLTIAEQATAVDGRVVPAGQAYLAPLSVERSDLASYYTPTDLVDLLLARSLDPLIDQRLAEAGPDPQAQAEALLSLKIVDPACGSAAILVGALDRIAYALAKARSQPHEPRDIDLTHARRAVLQHCIYGVDKDPFAVELAKVALWIHCIVPDEPLSFLDTHIVCGDALVGWPLLDIPNEIPSAAYEFKAADKDDKAMLTTAKNRNNAFLAAAVDADDALFALAKVDPDLKPPFALTATEHTYADVRAKQRAYVKWRDSDEYAKWKKAADLWTAAFFWTAEFGRAPTTSDYQQAVNSSAEAELTAKAARIVEDLNPLHWPLAFPEARAQGGFDLVIGNPPWEETASIEQEFFAQAAPHIAAMTSEHRGDAIGALEASNPSLHSRWLTYKATKERFAHFAKTSGRFTRTTGKTNTYVLFTEVAAANSGHAGLIVKTGIAVDQAQSRVWQRVLEDNRVHEVTDIVNASPSGARVFPVVAAVERFCVLVLRPHAPTAPTMRAAMLNFGVEKASTAAYREWPRADLAAFAPRTRTLPSTSRVDEIDLALELQKRWETLDFSDVGGLNPWGIRLSDMFNSTIARRKGWLLREEALFADGYGLGADKVFRRSDGRVAIPVYEGQMANRWDHRARTFEGYRGANKYGKKPDIPRVTETQHADVRFEVQPRYWMHADIVNARLEQIAGEHWLIAIRDIGRPWTDRRIMRTALLGRYPATDTLPVISVAPEHALRLTALFNSMVFDFLVRIHMPGGHVTPWIVSQCAAPPPRMISPEVEGLAATLSITSQALADLTGWPVQVWTAKEREWLDAKVDAHVARAYGLTLMEYETVLDHFDLLRKIEERDDTIGEYRSKRLRLEAFEEIGGVR
ncbi:Eco57I restriction-modification methylase domain-containing protein [Geodermatophilus ruber]|uniref:site-specific DNA-methyltransferase (adenine-specific) n=1 Tax=Geodermatophilus ruber TaxID=504800 RepID=A0A1I4CXF0_9ACTN|nr:hypothetical protein [Geodermatophilus ruber]SFK86024.1 hypothetical protein SAMN04488085_10478 [Geodermatophilus ruber]